MRRLSYIFLILFAFQFFAVQAEIQKVTISWVPVECDKNCNQLLQKFLDRVTQARKVEVHPTQGYADLFWKPKTEFKIDDVRLPMMKLGLKVQILNIEARGTITHSGKKFYLHSLGDSTVLELLNPGVPSTEQYVEESNIQTHYIRDPLKSKLLEIEKKHLLATVRGYIFLLQRQQLKLVVENVSATD